MTRDRAANLNRLDVGFAAGIAIILMLGGAALALPDTDCHHTRERERGTGAQYPGLAAGPPEPGPCWPQTTKSACAGPAMTPEPRNAAPDNTGRSAHTL